MTDGTNWDCGEGRVGRSQDCAFTPLSKRGLDRLAELGGSERGRTGQTVSDRSDRNSGGPKCQ